MGDEQGYDDQFNDGLFQATVHNGRRDRPGKWPKSVSEMRQHTVYTGQNSVPDRGDAHSNFMTRRQSTREGFEYGRAYSPRRARANEGFAYNRTYNQRRPRQDRFYDPKSGVWTWGDQPPQKR